MLPDLAAAAGKLVIGIGERTMRAEPEALSEEEQEQDGSDLLGPLKPEFAHPVGALGFGHRKLSAVYRRGGGAVEKGMAILSQLSLFLFLWGDGRADSRVMGNA